MLSVLCLPRKVTTSPRQHLRTSYQQTCWTSGSSRTTAQWPPRSRSVLIGWQDPMIYPFERAAPTPTQEGTMVTLQWLASAKVTRRIADLTNAFGQARQTSRKIKLATKLTPGVTHPAVGPRQLLRVETEICGLVSGPSWLRASLTVDLLAAGYVKNLFNKCLFTLFSSR